MEFLSELWMPILLSAAFVWIASSVMHMVLPHHKSDYAGLPNEDRVTGALAGVAPGQYMFPFTTMAEMKSPEHLAKMEKGPNGILTIWAVAPNMGRNLGLMLLLYLVIGVFIAYVGSHSSLDGAPYLSVFRICGAIAFMAHGLGWIPHMIWFGTKGFWAYTFDSVVYALVTAGVFGWLWPS